MAIEIVMPKLGWTMEEGVLDEWIKQDGDQVEPGDIVFTVESDKALQEIEAFDSGILHIPSDSPPPGSTIKIGVLLAYILEPGEQPPLGRASAEPIIESSPAVTETNTLSTPSVRRNGRQPAISPRARRVAAELGVDWTILQGSGSTGRIVERDVRAAAQQPTPPAAVELTPVARRAAQELGVDLNQLAAQFPGKRITREDVEAAAHRAPADAPAAAQRAPISNVRRIIGERMATSAQTTAAVTLTTEADATELVHLRQQLKTDVGRAVPSYNDLLTKLAAHALLEHSQLNARFDGDDIVQHSAVHIGLAVDTERGLLVPVIHDVPDKSLRTVAAESADLIERARAGTLRPDELGGSTFSITNLGMYQIDAFTPIINLPECAILGIGRIVPKQVVIDVVNERVAIRHMLYLSLTFDHRLVDGAPAARFLQRVKHLIEQPYLWLAG
jgi:pyruvate dehydrogenase E2 component (dihydrolipoamide acetyltransferase)